MVARVYAQCKISNCSGSKSTVSQNEINILDEAAFSLKIRMVKGGLLIFNSESGANNNGDDSSKPGQGTQTLVRPKPEVQEPSMYKVVLLNDDFTPMDFVVHILQKFFSKSTEEATTIMLQVHQVGNGIAGVFTHEIAETKVYVVNDYARKNKHPLKCVMEKT